MTVLKLTVFQFISSAVGALTILYIISKALFWVFIHFLVYNNWKCYGAGKQDHERGWALITGSSEGIGLALAQEAARRGMNVMLVARSEVNLAHACIEIRKKFPDILTEYIAADCSVPEHAVDVIFNVALKKNITVLINNVGVEAGDPEPFEEKTINHIKFIINVNIVFGTLLTRRILPLIINNCKRTAFTGAIVNLSSNASILDTPLLVSYTASKEYNRSFSNTLAAELNKLHGRLVDVMCVRPSFVETRMSGLQADSWKGMLLGVVTAESFAATTLNKLGYVQDISPCWKHDIGAIFLTLLPRRLNQWFMYKLTSTRYRECHQASLRTAPGNEPISSPLISAQQ